MRRYARVVIIFGIVFEVIAQNITDEKCGIQDMEDQYPWLVDIEAGAFNRIVSTGALITAKHVVVGGIFPYYTQSTSVRLNTYNTGVCPARSGCLDNSTLRINIASYKKTLLVSERMVLVLITLSEEAPALAQRQLEDVNNFRIPVHSKATLALQGRRRTGVKLFNVEPFDISPIGFDVNRPICLPSADVTLLTADNQDLYYLGRGTFPVTYENHSACGGIYRDYQTFVNQMICAKSAEGIIQCARNGKLNAILMNKRGNRYELAGILEALNNDCVTVGLFHNMFLHRDWIQTTIEAERIAAITTTSTSTTEHIIATQQDSDECGRRKVDHVELIVNGQATKAGDWPWHVALYKLNKYNFEYRCGGTLISKTLVLTAAHCVTEQGAPIASDILSVTLGKYNLIGPDLQSQERLVHSVIVHEGFLPNVLANDIAILKLRTEAFYNDYVQPACIWSNEAGTRLTGDIILGTVVGWGINSLNTLSSQLNQANMPQISLLTCIKRNPSLYAKLLDEKKFCAGWANGTSACNGDSGGAYVVFVPDDNTASSEPMGSWYARGIVSATAAIRNEARCDPNQYVVFTDVNKYVDWIQRYLVK